MYLFRHLITTWVFLCLTACSSNPPAPVVDRLPVNKSNTVNKPSIPSAQNKPLVIRPTYKAGDWRPDTYIVKKGDTLFSIGLEHGYDYKEIAQANNITAPYNIKVGQALKFSTLKEKPVIIENNAVQQEKSDGVEITPMNTDSSSTNTAASSAVKTTQSAAVINEPKAIREIYSEDAMKRPPPSAKPAAEKPVSVTASTKPANASTADTNNKIVADTKPVPKPSSESPEDIDWAWPTKGKVITSFNEISNKGLDISGSTGQSVNAAASGKVIYSGSDLRGYGKLVIIKHNTTYLSVYANNSQIMVKEGQQVSRGQKIAEMGNSDSNTVKLHFEIRRQGQSVDPSKYLTTN